MLGSHECGSSPIGRKLETLALSPATFFVNSYNGKNDAYTLILYTGMTVLFENDELEEFFCSKRFAFGIVARTMIIVTIIVTAIPPLTIASFCPAFTRSLWNY